MNYHIYVVFSATPYKMGKFIRMVTRQEYNHVSIALDDKLQGMYSFARHYKDTPFYGGFVEESHLRYSYKNIGSTIQIAAIPLTQEEYEQIETYIKAVQENKNQYLYNTFSAICTPIRYRVPIDKSYTCTEFVVDTLAQVKQDIRPNTFYSLSELNDLLKEYNMYRGSINEYTASYEPSDEQFLTKHNIMIRFYYTFILFQRLMWRLWKGIDLF